MRLDPWALARMTWLAVLFGVGLSLFLEVLRFVWCLFGTEEGGTAPEKSGSKSGIGGIVALFFRDVLFFVVAGVAFSVFVYCTNDGRVRFTAVSGALLGFFIGYATVGRILRSVNGAICRVVHGVAGVIVFPARWLFRHARGALIKLKESNKNKAAGNGGSEGSDKRVRTSKNASGAVADGQGKQNSRVVRHRGRGTACTGGVCGQHNGAQQPTKGEAESGARHRKGKSKHRPVPARHSRADG